MDVVVTDLSDQEFLLDLLNTTPVVDGAVHDVLADAQAARRWMREHDVAPTKTETTALLEIRPLLQKVVRGDGKASALKHFLAGVHLRPVVGQAGVEWRMETGDAPVGAVRAVLAWDGLRITSPGRLRPCANTECRLFLIDRSKPNTARWCSMAMCGNRMKARRHYRRAHGGDEL